jgi:hypothetical protein
VVSNLNARQRPQHQLIYQPEDRGGATYTQRQCEYHEGGEGALASDGTEGEANVRE